MSTFQNVSSNLAARRPTGPPVLLLLHSPADLRVGIIAESHDLMVSGTHQDGRRYNFVKRDRIWHLVLTRADAEHPSIRATEFALYADECARPTSTLAIPSTTLTNSILNPPDDWLSAISKERGLHHVWDFDPSPELPPTSIINTKSDYFRAMSQRLGVQRQFEAEGIRVRPDDAPADYHYTLICNWFPMVVKSGLHEDDHPMCPCCGSYARETNLTYDIRKDFLFHFCRYTDRWFLLIDEHWIDQGAATEMFQNQAAMHAKFQQAKTLSTTSAYQVAQEALHAQHPRLVAEHPSNVLDFAGGNSRPGVVEKIKWTPQLRPACCLPVVPGGRERPCCGNYNNPNHRRDFIHLHPINSTDVGLTPRNPVHYLNVEDNFTHFDPVDVTQFLPAISVPVAREHPGLDQAAADQFGGGGVGTARVYSDAELEEFSKGFDEWGHTPQFEQK